MRVTAMQFLLLGGKARALLNGRSHVSTDDVRSLAAPVLRHRIVLHGDGGADEIQGGPGRDTITGGAGNDRLFGNDGKDRLEGDGGAETKPPL